MIPLASFLLSDAPASVKIRHMKKASLNECRVARGQLKMFLYDEMYANGEDQLTVHDQMVLQKLNDIIKAKRKELEDV